MRKLQKALMFSFLALILLLSSFILPWWGLHVETKRVDGDGDTTYRKDGYGIPLSFFYMPVGGTSGATFYGGTSTSLVFTLTAAFVILAMIFTGLFIVSILTLMIDKTEPPNLLKTFGILAMVFCILAPLIFMVGLPGALKADSKEDAEYYDNDYEEPDHDDPTKSFFGSHEEKDEDLWDGGSRTDTTNWGGDIGWNLAFVSFIFILLAFLAGRSAVGVAMPPQQQYPQGPLYPAPTQPIPGEPILKQPLPPPPTQPQPHTMGPTQVTCPSCKKAINTNITSFPAPIKCPHCGTRGFIE